MQDKSFDLIIIGGGPAGLTAAIYTSRAQINTLLLAGSPSGGQLMLTSEVENFPGFVDGIIGPELITNMRNQAEKFGTKTIDTNVESISGSDVSGFVIETTDSEIYSAKAVIIATGASAKWLNIESEQRLRGRGISACAVCDGFFFKGKTVAVVGGGDAAMEEATYLTKFADKVYVLVRGAKENLRASKIMQERAFSNSKIEFFFNVEIKEVLGDTYVSGLLLRNTYENNDLTLDVSGLFLAIGHQPNTAFLKDFIELDKVGYVSVTNQTNTSKKGVFVAGDVSDFRYRQAVTAAGLGCMAALDVEKYLSGHN